MQYWENKYTALLHKQPHQECVRCVMNTSDPEIEFNEGGVCSYCSSFDTYLRGLPSENERLRSLDQMTQRLKDSATNKQYDSIIGLSGGVDSSYLAWFAVKELGLRPLIVHVDAGWNSEIAVKNIQNLVQCLNLDLYTFVVDWAEMRDLQRSYFLSGIANLDVPQDHAFMAALYRVAARLSIRNVLNGSNFQTEAILPKAWEHDASDLRNLLAIQRKFGTSKLKKYPMFTTFDKYIKYPIFHRMLIHRPLNLIGYNKEKAKMTLQEHVGWRDYGGKHHESVFTRFHQGYYLPTKFGYDKRIAHLSTLIVNNQISRAQAKAELQLPLYDPDLLEQDRKFVIKKLGIKEEKFRLVMDEAPIFYYQLPNNDLIYKMAKLIR